MLRAIYPGACSTSGMAYKIRGRVGDSPIIGAGLYVDNEVGAATATGVGEEVVRIAGTHLVVEKMREGYTPLMPASLPSNVWCAYAKKSQRYTGWFYCYQ